MVQRSWLVLTTGRLFCSRYVDALDLRIVRCPVQFPPLTYYQLWHERTHAAPPLRWLRERVRDVARDLAYPRSDFVAPPQGGNGSGPAEPDPRRSLEEGLRSAGARQETQRSGDRK